MGLKSIQTKLLVLFLPFFIVSFSVLGAISYYFSTNALSKSVDETAMAIGADHAGDFEADVMRLQVQLEAVASMARVRAGTDRALILEAVSDTYKRIVDKEKIDNILYLSLDGSAIRSDGTTANLADREYFQKVVATKQPYVSDPLVARATGKMSVNVTVPVS